MNLLSYALKHFYPKNRFTYEDITYPSIVDKYNEWLNLNYTNGTLYIGEAVDITVTDRNRSISSDLCYLVEKNGRYYFSVKVIGFSKSQEIKVTVTYNENSTVTIEGGRYKDSDYTLIGLGDGITNDNVKSISISGDDMVLENYIRYGAYNTVSYSRDEIVPISFDDFTYLIENKFCDKLQRYITLPQVQRYMYTKSSSNTAVHFYGFRMKDFLPSVYLPNQRMSIEFKAYNDLSEGYIEVEEGMEQVTTTTVLVTDDAYQEEDISWYGDLLDYTTDRGDNNGYFTKLEIIITILPKDRYKGMIVKLVFDDVEEVEYMSPVSVKYLDSESIVFD